MINIDLVIKEKFLVFCVSESVKPKEVHVKGILTHNNSLKGPNAVLSRPQRMRGSQFAKKYVCFVYVCGKLHAVC